MKISVELEDFYIEEGQISSELKRAIITESVSTIKEFIKDRINTEVVAIVKRMTDEYLSHQLTIAVADCVANCKIKGRYSTDPDMTIQEYVMKQFYDQAEKKTPTSDYIEKQCRALGDEIKKRYDMNFAAGIVAKLHEHNLLKEEGLSKLLSQEK